MKFKVYGLPVTQGSKKGFVVGKRVNIVDVNDKKLKDWRATVAQSAQVAGARMIEKGRRVTLLLKFMLPRPKYHFDNEGGIKEKYKHVEHVKKPDLSKMVRAVEDALSGVCYYDDCQITKMQCEKAFADGEPWVEVQVIENSAG